MKKYCNVKIEVLHFKMADVITASIDPGAQDYDFYPGVDVE